MNSSSSELEHVSTEINNLSLQQQQLQQRKNLFCLHQELRNQIQFGDKEEYDNYQQKIDQIDEKLKQLSAKIAQLQKTFDNHEEVVIGELSEKTDAGNEVFYVECPNITAPVVLDVENLLRCSCRTQCPECRQVVMTETISSTSPVAWILCYLTAGLGCVAGCCLIPFCLDRFKSVTHKCPLCRTSIRSMCMINTRSK